MSKILYINTDGTKSSLPEGMLGYDAYAAGGDEGRVGVGTASGTDILLSKKEEVDALENRVDTIENTQVVANVVAGTGVTVDATDPANPVINVDGNQGTLAEQTKTYNANEESIIVMLEAKSLPVVSVAKELPQIGQSNNDWNVDSTNYTYEDFVLDTTITPSATTGDITLTLGTGNFTADNVGMRIVGNGGEVVLTATDGSATVTTDFNDTITIASGDWNMYGISASDDGIECSGVNNGYSISNAIYTTDTFSVIAQDGNMDDIVFGDDGYSMYLLSFGTDTVYRYTLLSPYDITTASYLNSKSVTSEDSAPKSIDFSVDGTKMLLAGLGNDSIYSYTLSTAWDITTAVYDNVSVMFTGTTIITGVRFADNGYKIYAGYGEIYQYGLTTPYDLSTASYSTVSSLSLTTDNSLCEVSTDGKIVVMSSAIDNLITKIVLSTPYDLSTASVDSSFNVNTEDDTVTSVAFSKGGAEMFMHGKTTDNVYKYDTGSVVYISNQNLTAISPTISTDLWTDINSMTVNETDNGKDVHYALSTDNKSSFFVMKDGEGDRSIVRGNGGTWEYNSSVTYTIETWTPATRNNVYGALSEAMDIASNKMPKAQLEAVQDTNFPATTTTLDLAIVLKTDDSTVSPISDGVTVNYDSNSYWGGAVLGTDYEWTQTAPDKVKIKSLIASNMKTRIV